MNLVPVDNTSNPTFKQGATIDKYIELGSSIDEVNKPDNRAALIKTYGEQLIGGPVGLLNFAGATRVQSVNDEVDYWEEARLHKTQNGTIASTSASDTGAKTITTTADHTIIDGDWVMVDGKTRARALSTGDKTYTVTPVKGTWGVSFSGDQFVKVHKIGNEFAQGTGQPTEYEESNLVKRTQKHMILKWTYRVTGSQMGNIAWVKDTDTGSFYWYQKGLHDTRKRAENYLESMALFAQEVENSNITTLDLNGFDGHFSTVEKRGFVNEGYVTDITELEDLSVKLDKQGASGVEYIAFQNRVGCNYFDRMVADRAGSVSQPSYGSFSNGKDMALALGFKSVSVGGRTFHNKPLQVLIDPTFGGQTDYYKGVMIPMGTTIDQKTNSEHPLLELNIKGYPDGSRRYMEHWPEGGVNGIYTNGDDERKFNWRTEYNMITRAANRHVVIRG